MTIATRSTNLRRRKAARLEEARCDEITVVHAIGQDYEKADNAADERLKAHFQAMWALADDKEERDAIARAFAEWGRGEQIEGMAVTDAVKVAIEVLKANNPLFLHDIGPDGTPAA